MDGWTETHRSFVNTWECDENNHLNVQFYLKCFSEAARIFGALEEGTTDIAALPGTRHVRYHHELHPGAMTRIRSGRISDGPFAGWVVHRLEDVTDNRLSATAIDAPSADRMSGKIPGRSVQEALPRGLQAEQLQAIAPEHILAMNGLVSHRSVVMPAECDSANQLAQQFYVSRFSDCAPHVWKKAGIGEAWLKSRGYGRVAVEMKISHHLCAYADDILFLYSNCEVAGKKTLKLRHEVVRQSDMTAIASAEVLVLILDLNTRKSVPLPSEIAR